MNQWRSHGATTVPAEDERTVTAAYRAEDIHSQLRRVLGSSQFRASLRLTCFLKFVVETALAGHSERIKAYTIAVEALGRGEDFDPQRDPIVRVEAGRLRWALAHYYAREGRDDAVLIDLPRGAYVPRFRRMDPDAARQAVRAIVSDVGVNKATAAANGNEDVRQFCDSVSDFFGRTAQLRGSVGQLFGRAKQCRELARIQQDRLVEYADLVHSARHILNESNRLLAASAVIDPAPMSPVLLAERGDRASEDDPSGESFMRRAIAHAASRARGHARFFKFAFGIVALLALLDALFDIDRPLTGGPSEGLVAKFLLNPGGADQRR